jgi:hypothetical protein
MVVTDLKQHQQAKAKPAKRKHHGVRTPTARNAIVRNREHGMYEAHVDGVLTDSDTAINLRLNALELNVSKLMRGYAVTQGYAAPLPDNVVPMHSVKEQEQSKVVQHSHPLPVAGNEAVVLPAPEPIPVPLKTGDTEPKHIGKVTLVPSEEVAANDEILVPEETVELLKEITDESPETMERLADAYGMDIVEASQILYKEYAKREKHCYDTHGMERNELQIKRAIAQRGLVDSDGGMQRACPSYTKSEDSRFSDWWCETEARMRHLHGDARLAREPKRDRAPLTKGEAAYRKKVYVRSVASRRPAKVDAMSRLDSMHRKLHVAGPGVTTMSQVEALKTATWGGYQRVRKLFGMQPTVRGTRKRLKYEVADLVAEHNAAIKEKKESGVLGPDIPMAEVSEPANVTPMDT